MRILVFAWNDDNEASEYLGDFAEEQEVKDTPVSAYQLTDKTDPIAIELAEKFNIDLSEIDIDG